MNILAKCSRNMFTYFKLNNCNIIIHFFLYSQTLPLIYAYIHACIHTYMHKYVYIYVYVCVYDIQLFSLSFNVFIFRPNMSYMDGFGSVSWSVSELQSLSLELSYVPRPGNMPIHLSPLYPLLSLT